MKLLCLILLLALFSGCKSSEGPIFAEVEGNSMLPELHGRAIYETCPKCGFHGLRCPTGTSVCPNCGWLTLEKERETLPYEVRPADRLRVVPQEKYAHDDLVVVVPSSEIGPVVKRVVGVPGDRLEVRDGVLFRNGKRVVHTLETWLKTRILVFNDDFRPEGRSRWKVSEPQTDQPRAGWELESGGDALTYEHETARFTSDGCRFVPGPITSQRAENGTLFPASAIRFPKEFMLEFEAEFGTDENEGCICVTFPTFRLTWKGNRSKGRKTRFIFSTLDGLPRLWINGRPVPSAEMEAEKGDFGTIQVRNLAGEMVALRHLVLWRGEIWEDFSANYHNFTKKEKNLVAFDCGSEYYIIGNNLFVSEDSRVWGGISPRQILGRATLINNE